MVHVAAMYSPVKVVPYIQEGLHSKNNRWEALGCILGLASVQAVTARKATGVCWWDAVLAVTQSGAHSDSPD